MSTVSYKSNTHSKVLEGWTNKVDKKLLDKLRLRDPTVTSPFTKFLRYKLASAWPWEVYISTVSMCMLVPEWKKVVGPLSSMLKFVHQYLESFGKVASQTKDNSRKIAFEWFITNFLRYLDSEVKTSPLLKSFKQKVIEIRAKYFTYGETTGLAANNPETQEFEMEEEQVCNQIQVTVDQVLKAKFESKRKSAISKIKSKQSHFVNELENTANEPVLNLKLDARSDLECAVTKEKISSSNVYYFHTQLHFTNLVSESIRKTLTLIAQNTEVHDSQDVQRALTMVDQLGTDRHLLEDIVLTSCSHILKSRESASRSVLEIYDPIERPCALCKKPTNLMLPVYPEDLWHRLEGQSASNTLTERRAANEPTSFENFVQVLLDFQNKATASSPNSDSMLNLYAQHNEEHGMEPTDASPGWVNCLPDCKLSTVLKEKWAAESKDELISKCKQVSNGATTDMLDFYKQFVGLRSKIADPLLGQLSPKDALAYCTLDWSWGNPDDAAIYQVSPLAASCWIFSSNVRYMELKGFANSVKSFGLILHSLYLNMKLCSLNDAITVQKRVSLMLESMKKLHLHQNSDRTRLEIFVLVLLATLTTGYQQEVLFQQILSYFVDLHVQVFLDDEHLNTKWEDLRYNHIGTPLSNSLLRLLRNAALIKFAWKFPVYKTSGGKLFEKIVQFNIKGDSRELDYLFLFLELETPKTLSDSKERTTKVYNWFERDAGELLQESSKLKLSDARLEARLLGGTPNFIFSLLRLPSHLRLLYDQYLFEACDKCGWHRALLVCLICGDKSCRKRCHPDSNHKNLVACGNATTHSMMHHNGTCAFFDCGTGHILVIEGNRVNLYTDVYKDKFGIVPVEGFHDPSHSLEKYTLSSDRLAEIKAQLLNQEVIQSVVLKSLTEEMFYHRNLM